MLLEFFTVFLGLAVFFLVMALVVVRRDLKLLEIEVRDLYTLLETIEFEEDEDEEEYDPFSGPIPINHNKTIH